MPDEKAARNVSKDFRRRSAITGRKRRFYARKLWRRRKWPEGFEQMNDRLRNDQPNKTESGPGLASRTPTVAASSSTNDHLCSSACSLASVPPASACHDCDGLALQECQVEFNGIGHSEKRLRWLHQCRDGFAVPKFRHDFVAVF